LEWGIKGNDVSNNDAHYEPVAWWFTKRLLGRELRKLYQATEELPAKLSALASKLGGTPTKADADYGLMAERCLKWARNTDLDEVRETYLQLAQFWLDTASKLDGLSPTQRQSARDAA
jgi:hypothetical protein